MFPITFPDPKLKVKFFKSKLWMSTQIFFKPENNTRNARFPDLRVVQSLKSHVYSNFDRT